MKQPDSAHDFQTCVLQARFEIAELSAGLFIGK